MFCGFVFVLVALTLRSAGAQCPGGQTCLAVDEDASMLLQVSIAKTEADRDLQHDTGAACPAKTAQVYITQAALDHFTKEVFPLAPIEVGALPLAPFTGEAAGLSYGVNNVQLVSFGASDLSLQLQPGQGLDVSITVQASVSVDFNLAFGGISKAGTVTLDIGASTISMSLIFGTNAAGNPSISASNAAATLNIIGVSFEDQATLSCLGDIWSSFLLPAATKFAEGALVEAIEASLQVDLAQQVASALSDSGLPMQNTTGPHQYDIAVQICDMFAATDYFGINAYVAVNTPGNVAHEGSPYDLDTTGYQVVLSEMLGLGATEWTIAGLVWLARRQYGLLGNVAVKLQESPGVLPDGRDMQAVADQKTREIVAEPTLKATLLPAGFEISNTKVKFFDKAVSALLSFTVDLPTLIQHFMTAF